MNKKKNIEFPKGFFTKPRPHVTEKEADEDMIPYKWPEEVLNGKKKVIVYQAKNNKK